MKAGKREDRLFIIIHPLSFCLAATLRSLSTKMSPAAYLKSRRGSS